MPVSHDRGRSWPALVLFTALFVLLFQYRILSLLNKMGGHFTPIGTRFPLAFDFQASPRWLHPVYHTLDYLNIVWFTTLLGLLIAGAAAAFLPSLARRRLGGNGMGSHLAGALSGLPNMFCTCCAASTFAGLRRAGAGLGPSLACFVASPSLNIVVLVLAFNVLPLGLALTRLVLGLVAAVGITYIVARMNPRIAEALAEAGSSEESPGGAAARWMRHTWEVARSVIPVLVLGIFIMGIFKTLVPFETIAGRLGNGLLPTLLASALGMALVVPTFTEVLWVGEFVRHGMGVGPAVALLITLPAVSFPSLWVLGRVLKSGRVAVALGILIMCLGLVAGLAASLL